MALSRFVTLSWIGVALLAGCAAGPDEPPPEPLRGRVAEDPSPLSAEASPSPAPIPVIDPPEPMPPAESRFAWPAEGAVAERGGASGVTLRASGDVRAVKSGVVTRTLSSWAGIRNLVIVRHADGFYSVYGDADRVLVPVGRAVRQGEAVARFSPAGGQLRFRLYRGATAVDPLTYLR